MNTSVCLLCVACFSASQKVDWVVDSWVAGHLRACNEILKMPFIMGEFGLPQPLSDRDLLYSRMYQAFEDEATSDRAGMFGRS